MYTLRANVHAGQIEIKVFYLSRFVDVFQIDGQ